MQGLHQNVLLLLMLVVTGVSVYIAIEMRKRLNKADTLIHSIESVTDNIVKKEDVDALKELIASTEPATVPERMPERMPERTPEADPADDEGSEIKIVQTTPKRRRVAKPADGGA